MQKTAEKLAATRAKKKALAAQKMQRKELNKRTAILRGVRMSAQKGRLVADMIRGKSVEQALYTLEFTQKKAAGIIKKVLESAIANAETNAGDDIDELKVKTIYVQEGPTLKRFMARAKGRGNRILKPTSHVYITLGN